MQKKSHSDHGGSGRVLSLSVLPAAESSRINLIVGASAGARHNTLVLPAWFRLFRLTHSATFPANDHSTAHPFARGRWAAVVIAVATAVTYGIVYEGAKQRDL